MLQPKRGYARTLDKHTNLIHYLPTGGRRHLFDKCWCHPIIDSLGGAIHHHYMKENKARC